MVKKFKHAEIVMLTFKYIVDRLTSYIKGVIIFISNNQNCQIFRSMRRNRYIDLLR